MRKLTFLIAWLLIGIPCSAEIVYVDANAGGGNDGSSWADAFSELQLALGMASSGDEIRVAQGVYKPSWIWGDRAATFGLINGVTIKGGYAGFGTPEPNTRDIEAYETILSGDLNDNDGPDFASNAENSYHVVTGSGTDTNAVLDGFTITGGNANGIEPNDCGGGMYNFSGSPTIINCIFIENFALAMGGGMFNREESSPSIANCVFIENKSDDDGGGIRNYLNCHPTITNCSFISNIAFEDGGGINNRKNSNATITNCSFIGNIALSGGGMENHVGHTVATGEVRVSNCIFIGNIGDEGGGMRNTDPNPIVTNCTFSGNIGGGMRNDSGSTPIVTNCIFWGNTGGSFDGSSSPIVTFSDVEGGFLGTGNIDADPCFIDAGYWDNNDTPGDPNDDIWVDGDYHLKSEIGRWEPNSETWVVDDVTSWCIDASDPNSDWTAELWPHGKRINMGTYGGTSEASMSLSDAGNIANLDNDPADNVDSNDLGIFVSKWCEEEILIAEDLNRDGAVNFVDYAIFADEWLW